MCALAAVAAGAAFERHVVAFLRRLGVAVTARGGPGDGGIDFAGSWVGRRVLGQCKWHGGRRVLGPSVVRDFVGAIAGVAGDGAPPLGMLVTTVPLGAAAAR